MLNWRYHLLSLTAVFLALTLGILIGAGLAGGDVINSIQDDLVIDIQSDLKELGDRNDELSREQAINERYQKDTYPFIVSGRLQGRKYALVMSAAAGDQARDAATSTVKFAGGQIVSITVLDSRFSAPELAEKVNSILVSTAPAEHVDESTAPEYVGKAIAPEIGKAGGGSILEALKGPLVVSTEGNYDAPVDGVILLTRAENEQTAGYSELESAFLVYLRENGVRAIACETTDAPISEIAIFQNTETSTVDNLDSRIGQISLVFALGGEGGSFGIKYTSDMLIPILREPRIAPVASP